jgi:hypothetical protein
VANHTVPASYHPNTGCCWPCALYSAPVQPGLCEAVALEELDLTACDLTDSGAMCMGAIVKVRRHSCHQSVMHDTA